MFVIFIFRLDFQIVFEVDVNALGILPFDFFQWKVSGYI